MPMPTKDEEIKNVQDKEKEPKTKPWYETLHPLALGGGALIIFIIFISMQQAPESNMPYLLMVVGIVVVLYLLSKSQTPQEVVLTPPEAEACVYREVDRKINWGQFPPMTKYEVLPINNAQHRNARGMFYDIGVTIFRPYTNVKENYVAKVYMTGPEKGNVSLIRAFNSFTGREREQEKTLLPDIVKIARRDKFIGRWVEKYT